MIHEGFVVVVARLYSKLVKERSGCQDKTRRPVRSPSRDDLSSSNKSSKLQRLVGYQHIVPIHGSNH